MTTADFIIALFYRIDNQMCMVPKHPQAALYSETVTLGVLYALKGGSSAPSTAGCAAIGWPFFHACPSARACFACGRPMSTGSMFFGRSRRRWA